MIDDFTIGYRDELQKRYPQFKRPIEDLTREQFATRPKVDPDEDTDPEERYDAFLPAEVPKIDIGPGIELHELAGRTARIKTNAYSIALFTLKSGQAMPASYNKAADEVFLVTTGVGHVVIEGQKIPVQPGSVVRAATAPARWAAMPAPQMMAP